jgi:hypothetical protein
MKLNHWTGTVALASSLIGNAWVTGDEGYEEGADEIGRTFRRRGGAPVASSAQGRIFKRPPLPSTPFQPTEAELRSYMGIGFQALGNNAAGVTLIGTPLLVEPQESFRGERLILDVTSTGTPVGNAALQRIEVGTMPQSPSVEQPAPATMFRADATYSQLDLQVAFRATKFQLTLENVNGPTGAGNFFNYAAGIFGAWIR